MRDKQKGLRSMRRWNNLFIAFSEKHGLLNLLKAVLTLNLTLNLTLSLTLTSGSADSSKRPCVQRTCGDSDASSRHLTALYRHFKVSR